MASYANNNSEKYILEKDVKEAILIKAPRPENLDPVKKLDDYLYQLLKQKKRSQDIAVDNTLKKGSRQSPGHCGKTVKTVSYGSTNEFRQP